MSDSKSTEDRLWVCHPDDDDEHVTAYDIQVGGCKKHPHASGCSLKRSSLSWIFDQELAKHVEEAVEPKRVVCTCRTECPNCGRSWTIRRMHLFPDDIARSTLNTQTVDGELSKVLRTTVIEVCGDPIDPEGRARCDELCNALEVLFDAHLQAAVREGISNFAEWYNEDLSDSYYQIGESTIKEYLQQLNQGEK